MNEGLKEHDIREQIDRLSEKKEKEFKKDIFFKEIMKIKNKEKEKKKFRVFDSNVYVNKICQLKQVMTDQLYNKYNKNDNQFYEYLRESIGELFQKNSKNLY